MTVKKGIFLTIGIVVAIYVSKFILTSVAYRKSEKAVDVFFNGRYIVVWVTGHYLIGLEREDYLIYEFEMIPSDKEAFTSLLDKYIGTPFFESSPSLPFLMSNATNNTYTLKVVRHHTFPPQDTISLPNGGSAIKKYQRVWSIQEKDFDSYLYEKHPLANID